MHTHPADPKSLGDGDRPLTSGPHLPDLGGRDGGLAAFVNLLALAASMPACCRSRMNLRSISTTMPSTVTRIGPAASLVEKVGSRTARAAPLASIEHVAGGAAQAVQLDHDQL
jgi:hypothetical protein